MRRYVNMAKSGRMAATRRATPRSPRPLPADAHSRGRRRKAVLPQGAGKRRT